MPFATRFKALAYGAVFVLLTTLVLAVQWPTSGRYALTVGEVSPADIRAPRSIDYISDTLTEEARQQAERRVADIYEPVRRVRSEQVDRAGEIFTLIDGLRADTSLSAAQKVEAIQELPDVQLEIADIASLLSLDDDAWERVKGEVPGALNVILLGEIRDTTLAAARRRVPSYIDLRDDTEAGVAIALVRALLKPNMLPNAERTQAARDEARAAVAPQTEQFAAGEIIVRAGDLLTARHIEALEKLDLYQRGLDMWRVGSALLISIVLAAIFGLYIFRAGSEDLANPRRLSLLLALLAGFLVLAKLMVPNSTLLEYFFPLSALTMLIAALLGLPWMMLVTIYFGVVIGWLASVPLPITTYATVGAVIGALVVGRGERTSAFVRAGVAIALSNILIVAAFAMPFANLDLAGYVQLFSAAVVNGALAASLTLIGFYFFGAIFDIATPLRLMELSRPNHPLLRDLVTKAPGTYHHSLLVSNLAEQAAEAVGADPFLTRVGAYYHDVGKIVRPHFFVENRADGVDPHSQLDPWSSAQIIITHIKDGLELAKKHKLPHRIRDFIAEHQGTGLVRFFYVKAQEIAGPEGVDEKDFRYPGPKPRSKETALLMLADSCESAVRATRPQSRDEVDEVVRKIINQKLIEGELSESPLTLQDLETVRQVFVRSLKGVHHPRVVYPEVTRQPQISSSPAPAEIAPPSAAADSPRPAPAESPNAA
ncbi:MAG: HDIG domain-containing protein [Anaerolineae bacterium]|nr:HDIG domain-containing protein [Anaerolineae bacterium]